MWIFSSVSNVTVTLPHSMRQTESNIMFASICTCECAREAIRYGRKVNDPGKLDDDVSVPTAIPIRKPLHPGCSSMFMEMLKMEILSLNSYQDHTHCVALTARYYNSLHPHDKSHLLICTYFPSSMR
ncbi:hypothetical protein RB195_012535 [Necator americanus]|uniref:Uncharacterized protein n=1 Tax=Necator americanus TaxID=51031 RepID=A0ABR1DU26_NECAM